MEPEQYKDLIFTYGPYVVCAIVGLIILVKILKPIASLIKGICKLVTKVVTQPILGLVVTLVCFPIAGFYLEATYGEWGKASAITSCIVLSLYFIISQIIRWVDEAENK